MAISVSHSCRGKFRRFLKQKKNEEGFLQPSRFTCSLAGANEPAVVTLLHHIHNVPLVQLHLMVESHDKEESQRKRHLVVILWFVVVEGTEGGWLWLTSSIGHRGARPSVG